MATVLETEPQRVLSGSHAVLYGITWSTYVDLRENPENYHLHMTYDEGTLEIMSPSPRHERYARYIDMLIGVWTEELKVPLCGLRQMTCKREDLDKGVEPDECYYVQNEAKVRGKTEIDFAVDPPPDLAIEVEVSRSSIPKAPIYAALGVRELWRYDGKKLRFFELVKGQYRGREEASSCRTSPSPRPRKHFGKSARTDDTEFKRRFRRWLRKTFGTGTE